MLVREYMKSDVVAVNSSAPIFDADKLMKGSKLSLLPVVDGNQIVSIITLNRVKEATRHDAFTTSIRQHITAVAQIEVKDVMRENVITVAPDTPIGQAMILAQQHGITSFLVVEKGKLVGMAAMADLLEFAN